MSGRCLTCMHWKIDEEDHYAWGGSITRPVDPDTHEPMEMPFEVRECSHPKLLFCERPVERDGFAVADGSTYRANLYTAENFGCVRWEQPPYTASTTDDLGSSPEVGTDG